MAVDDHGLEVLKKSGEEVTPGDKSDYFIKVGQVPGQAWDVNVGSVTVTGDSITSGTVDGTSSGVERTFVNNYKTQVLSAHDVVETYTWLDFASKKNRRVGSIVYTSATISGVTVTRTFNYILESNEYKLTSITWVTTPGG